MPSGNPRKSSTSSAKRLGRPRYLAVELAAGTHPLAVRSLEAALAQRLTAASPKTRPRVRVLRFDGRRSLVEVDHLWAGSARERWNGPILLPDGRSITVQTRRTYGTMRKGKQWLRSLSASEPGPIEAASALPARGP